MNGIKLESEPFISDEGLSIAKTVRAMDYLHAEEVFSTPEQSKEFLDSLSFTDFIRWITFLEGMETNIAIKDRSIGSSSHVEAVRKNDGSSYCKYLPPYSMHRLELLKMAFDKSQSISDPKTAGLTLGFAINAIHPYDDGNGRTARVIYSLLSRGYSGSIEDKNYYSKILVNTTGQEIVNPNPYSCGLQNEITKELNKNSRKRNGYIKENLALDRISGAYRDENDEWIQDGSESYEDLAVSEDIGLDDRKRLHLALNDGDFTMVAFYRSFIPERIAKYIVKREDNYGTDSFITGKNFVSSLSSDEINNFFCESVRVKYEYITKVINFSDRPDAQEYLNKFN